MALTDHPFTDLYLSPMAPSGQEPNPLLWKVNGEIKPIPEPFHAEARRLYEQAKAIGREVFSLTYLGVRMRGQLLDHIDGQTVVLRRHMDKVPRWAELGMPPGAIGTIVRGSRSLDVPSLVERKSGLVVVCGEADAGKSTTLAALIKEILDLRPWLAITIEDPVELPLSGPQGRGFCYQRNVDLGSFGMALRDALRMNPDIILVGEIRDDDTAATAVSAATTGHMVLASVHAADIPQAIRRVISYASQKIPKEDAINQVSASLYCCIHQRLERVAGGERRLNAQMVFTNSAVQAIIRDRPERLNDVVEQQRKLLERQATLNTA